MIIFLVGFNAKKWGREKWVGQMPTTSGTRSHIFGFSSPILAFFSLQNVPSNVPRDCYFYCCRPFPPSGANNLMFLLVKWGMNEYVHKQKMTKNCHLAAIFYFFCLHFSSKLPE
jgi:hypothetical protein